MPTTHRANTRHIGWREQIALPDLGIQMIHAKIDTGARTSAVHAVNIETFECRGVPWISFNVPLAELAEDEKCTAPLHDQREIKNTSGVPELRHVIRTTLVLDRRHWTIELSLANREQMGFDVILGRTALRSHSLVVDPGRSYLCGLPQVLTATTRAKDRVPKSFARSVVAAQNAIGVQEEEE